MCGSGVKARYCPILVAAVLAAGIPGFADVAGAQEAEDTGQSPKGVVIEEVGEGSALEQAGLRPGDVIWAWERPANPPANTEADRGEIESVFDWIWLDIEQMPRGTLKLSGEQAGVERIFEVAMGPWGGKVRPHLSDRVLEVYIRGREMVQAGDVEQGVELWSQLTEIGEAKSDGRLHSWIQLLIGEAYAEKGAWKEALKAYLAALEEVAAPVPEVVILYRIGKVHERRSVWDQAEASYQSALKIVEATWGRSLHTANMKHQLGRIAVYRGRLGIAANYFRDALKIREKLAPESLDLAKSLISMGVVARARGQLELASAYYQRALEIQELLAPESLDLAASLNNLGAVASFRGQLDCVLPASVYDSA